MEFTGEAGRKSTRYNIAALTTGVLVPTYRRPDDLMRCLGGLKAQSLPPDQVIVTVRDTDELTRARLPEMRSLGLPLEIVTVSEAGVVAAMNEGRKSSRTDIVAFLDDDACPWPDWLERIHRHLSGDPLVVGVGGRDVQYYGGKIVEGWRVENVGQVGWFGRTIGNHHLDFRETIFVDVLKGVNMAFRSDAIRDLPFDTRLLGTGAQVHFEMFFCLALRRQGYKILFDPETAVDHFPAARFDEDARASFNPTAYENACFNEALCLLEYLPWPRRQVFRVWTELIGTRANYGLVQALRFLPSEGRRALEKYRLAHRALRRASRVFRGSFDGR